MGNQCCSHDQAEHRAKCPLCSLGDHGDKRLCMDQKEFHKVVDALFDEYDVNKDGVMEQDEVKRMLEDLARKKQRDMTSQSLDSYVAKYMQKADQNHDGKIDKSEFYHFYKPK